MTTHPPDKTWERFQKLHTEFPSLGLSVDLSRTTLAEDALAKPGVDFAKAFAAMQQLEAGAIANPDEQRMVGHYWLRNAALAPTEAMRQEITTTLEALKRFAADVHAGRVRGAGGVFQRVLVVGIGGSALGPQFVAAALGQPAADKMAVHFFDNTDPDGMAKVLAQIGADLPRTLTVVISKSGGTKETRNGMLTAKAAYEKAGLAFAAHAVAVTGVGSELDRAASSPAWLARFPMWDWVGGRTSETSAVGLLPALLQGLDVDAFLAGARATDEQTRVAQLAANPAAQLALAWHHLTNGRGERDMVILPYKDRLELFSKYLQQLIMESLGKEKDLDGRVVHQGIAVYGNKGATDQHAYIQQLRDGVPNFFATFIEVLADHSAAPGVTSLEVEPGVTSGDYLQGFFLGTRQALHESGRASITLTIRDISPFTIGVLIALYERAVGLYATLVNVNAYHQPGVEAGKKAAGAVLALQLKLQSHCQASLGRDFSISELAAALGAPGQTETLFKLCEHLAANGRLRKVPGSSWPETRYGA